VRFCRAYRGSMARGDGGRNGCVRTPPRGRRTADTGPGLPVGSPWPGRDKDWAPAPSPFVLNGTPLLTYANAKKSWLLIFAPRLGWELRHYDDPDPAKFEHFHPEKDSDRFSPEAPHRWVKKTMDEDENYLNNVHARM